MTEAHRLLIAASYCIAGVISGRAWVSLIKKTPRKKTIVVPDDFYGFSVVPLRAHMEDLVPWFVLFWPVSWFLWAMCRPKRGRRK